MVAGLRRISSISEVYMTDNQHQCACGAKAKRAKPCTPEAAVKHKKALRAGKIARPCVFLDRDGVINKGGLINKPSDFELIPGVVEAIVSLKRAGFLVGIVTNQSGLSEDYEGKIVWKNAPLSRAQLHAIHDEMIRLLGKEARPYFIKACPHAKKLNCRCRKPKPGMLNAAARKYKIDKSRSFMVGDMATDIQAGINAGVTPLLVLSGYDSTQKDSCPSSTLAFPSLREAAQHIIATTKQPRPAPVPGKTPRFDTVPEGEILGKRRPAPVPGRGPVFDTVPQDEVLNKKT